MFVRYFYCNREYFNPLPPHGGRRHGFGNGGRATGISIHSLRMEGDIISYRDNIADPNFNPLPPHGGRPCRNNIESALIHFNPLPPHGGRLCCKMALWAYVAFQSTPSAWRETRTIVVPLTSKLISIHSLRMEGDGYPLSSERERLIFQSTPSAWRETF